MSTKSFTNFVQQKVMFVYMHTLHSNASCNSILLSKKAPDFKFTKPNNESLIITELEARSVALCCLLAAVKTLIHAT